MASLFKEYATSIAFRVDLTKSMAMTLHAIDLYDREHKAGIYSLHSRLFDIKELTGSTTDPFTAASRALLRRGLVEWRDRPARSNEQTWFITEAGRHVLALCRLAEVVPQAPTAQVKPLRRKAA